MRCDMCDIDYPDDYFPGSEPICNDCCAKNGVVSRGSISEPLDTEESSSSREISKLIACPDCGKEISKRARSCPNCGCPMTNEVPENDLPKCPTCKSTNIEKISTAKKAAYVIGFGILAPAFRKVRKTFVCNSCGYQW